jgi:hypothetical protein
MEAALEQLDFGLRLVVPIAAAPGPRVAGRRGFRNDDDAPPLPFDLNLDGVLFIRGDLIGLDDQVGFVHEEIVTVEPVPGRFLAVERDEVLGPSRRPAEADDDKVEQRPCDETRQPFGFSRF